MNCINMQLLLLLISCLSLCSFSDGGGSEYSKVNVDRIPSDVHGGSPEKPLPDEYVHDSNEPNDGTNFEPDWRDTINRVVAIALYVQVALLVCYILVSKACCIKIQPSGFADEYPLKPWRSQHEQPYDMSERRYLSKEDPMPSDGDFDTDPEDVEMIN